MEGKMYRLKELRLQNKLSQIDVSKKTGIEYQNYNKYELNKNEPNIDTLKKLADFYNVSLDYLCGRQFNNKIGYIPSERVELLNTIVALSDTDFFQINNYIKGYLDGKSVNRDVDFYSNYDSLDMDKYNRDNK